MYKQQYSIGNKQTFKQANYYDQFINFYCIQVTTNEITPYNTYSTVELANTIGRLVLSCVTEEHEAEYTCVAEHQWNKISSSTQLVIGQLM